MSEVTGITGNGRVYKRFDMTNDVIEDQSFVRTRGLWTGNVGDLYNFYTGSSLTATQKEHYYSVYQSQSSACDSAVQFSVAYGHRLGSGSQNDGGQVDDTPTRAIYNQYRLLCLQPDDTTFSFVSASTTTDSDHIYVVNFAQSRMEDKVDPGNWQLSIAYMSGSTATASIAVQSTASFVLNLIDDSGDADQSATINGLTSPIYNIVSGTISDGIYNTSLESYGLFYPDLGLIVLNGNRMDAQMNFASYTASNVNGDNAFRLFTAISGAAAPTAARSALHPFTARSAEKITTGYYFVRIGNREFNFSNNPTYITGSEGQLFHQSFEKDPKTYITAVGLYNDSYELMAVAKLSQAIKKSFTDESHITIKLEY